MRVNERIKEQRQKMRYTQKQLAEKVRVSPQVISNWERGYTEPSAEDINHLAEVLECTSDYLLGRSDSLDKRDFQNSKEEKDIAKRLEKFKEELETSDGLAFDGEPMSEEAKESLLESMELLFKQTQRLNKKFAPKKYREEE